MKLHRIASWLPFILLLLVLSTIFFFSNDRGYFYRPGLHDAVTSHHMTIIANLSPEHNFYRFISRTLDANGNGSPVYETYHRFPILGYLLIKLATLPFMDELSAQIHSARLLILSFFVATVIFAYLSLCRLIYDEWIALAAILLSFSSFHLLYYNDMVTTEGIIDLFGIMLVFHGMVIFIQDGNFRQLLVKACIALLLGWHVFALILSFIIFLFGKELIHNIHTYNGSGKRFVLSLLRNQSSTLGVVSLLFGMLVLGFNLATEYIALNGEFSLTRLPTWFSVLRRIGQTEEYIQFSHLLSWYPYLKDQFSRIGGMVFPYYLLNQIFSTSNHWSVPNLSVLGIIVFGSSLIGLIFAHHKILWATLLVFVFCWMLPFRHHAYDHDYESIFYVGISMVFFTFCILGFLWICSLFREHIVTVVRFLSVSFAVFVFVLSVFTMSRSGYSVEHSIFHKKLTDDFEVIRKITNNRTIFIQQEVYNELHKHSYLFDIHISVSVIPYYLAGNVILNCAKIMLRVQSCIRQGDDNWDHVEFLLKSEREITSKALLTPENDFVFLYDKNIYDSETLRAGTL